MILAGIPRSLPKHTRTTDPVLRQLLQPSSIMEVPAVLIAWDLGK